MKYSIATLLAVFFVTSINIIGAQTLAVQYKNIIQVGRTGYYFKGIRDTGFGVDNQHGFHFPTTLRIKNGIELYFPYISYKRYLNRRLAVELSFEDFSQAYNEEDLAPEGLILVRNFKQIQLRTSLSIFNINKLSFSVEPGIVYRYNPKLAPGEDWVIYYVDHGFWREGFIIGEGFSEFGIILGMESSIMLSQRIRISVKGNWATYPKPPYNQIGGGAYIGYSF